MAKAFLEAHHLTKIFPGVKALDDVSLTVQRAEIHALCGENGAGKSTLIKILSGVYPHGAYSGEFFLEGMAGHFRNIREAEQAGIAVIYQELALVKEMTIGENIFLGQEPKRLGLVDWNTLYFRAGQLLEELGLHLNPRTPIKNLGIGQQQLVEIAKALSKNARLLILDEPSAALTEKEAQILMRLLRQLRERGVTCIYISHKIGEVLSIADCVTVLRDGKSVGTAAIKELDEHKLVALMVGRELSDFYPFQPSQPSQAVLEITGLTLYEPGNDHRAVIKNASFQIRRGEILGISGLMGAGRTELLMGIFGVWPGRRQGKIFLNGQALPIRQPQDAIRAGLGLMSEDRKRFGLVLQHGVAKNITLASLRKIAPKNILDENFEVRFSHRLVDELGIRAPSIHHEVSALSGGNQQKVVLAKWLLTEPAVLFLDEPTRGIDVGAKFEIYQIMNKLVRDGVAVVMVSSELPEILGMSHRILVLHEGEITGEFSREAATPEKVMLAATGRG
jgi:D-xylose transport system ATP-binding protein